MKKDISAMSEHELLSELVRQGRSAATARVTALVLLAAILLTLVIGGFMIIPKLNALSGRLGESLDTLDASLESAKRVFDSIDAETIESVTGSIKEVGDAAQKLGELVDDLNGLRTTIEQLRETLGGILGRFSS